MSSPAFSPRAQSLISNGIPIGAFKDSVGAIREVAITGTLMPRIPFITTISEFRSGPQAQFGTFISIPDFLAFQNIRNARLPEAITLNSQSVHDAARSLSDPYPNPLRAEEFVAFTTLKAKSGQEATAMVLISPKLSHELCSMDLSASRAEILARLKNIQEPRRNCFPEYRTFDETCGRKHAAVTHAELTDHPSRIAERYIQDEAIVWLQDRRVAAIPAHHALGLRAVIFNGLANHTREIPVGTFAEHGGQIIQDVYKGEYFARVHYTTYCPTNGAKSRAPLFTLIPGYAAGYLMFDDESGFIRSVKNEARALPYAFNLAAFVNVSPGFRHAFVEVVETTERAERNRRKTMPAYEAMVLKRALEMSGDQPITIQGRPFKVEAISQTRASRPDISSALYFEKAASFHSSITPKGQAFDTRVEMGPEALLPFFVFSQVKTLRLKAGGEEFDLVAL